MTPPCSTPYYWSHARGVWRVRTRKVDFYGVPAHRRDVNANAQPGDAPGARQTPRRTLIVTFAYTHRARAHLLHTQHRIHGEVYTVVAVRQSRIVLRRGSGFITKTRATLR